MLRNRSKSYIFMLRNRSMNNLSDKWTNVRIRKAITTRITNFLETEKGKKLGISNPSQFLDLTAREKLTKLEKSEAL